MKKISVRSVLYISAAFIFLRWLFQVIRNTFFMDGILDTFNSLSNVFLHAFFTAILTIFVVTLFLYWSKEKYRDIGFDKQNILKQIRTGLLFGIAIFILDTFITSPVLDALLPQTAAKGIDMSKLFINTYYLPVFIFIALFKGGFSEELWRIFILTRFEKLFGKAGLLLALLLSSLVFGIGHLYQGMGGMISAAIIGLLYALVYLRKRLALEAVFAHSTFNLIQIILGYIIYSGK